MYTIKEAKIEADKVSLKWIFSESFQFKIPEFQRPFSWKPDNFEKLFEDIFDSFKSDRKSEYFLGSVILQRERNGSFLIIDGQQRLFSLAILLAVMRDCTSSEGVKNSIQKSLYQEGDKHKGIPSAPRIVLWDDLKFLEDYIFSPSTEKNTLKFLQEIRNGTIKFIDRKDPIYSVFKAIEIFNQKYKEFLSNGLDGDFLTYLYNNVYFVVIYTDSLPYAIRIFNVLNTRGLPLTTADILKAENLAKVDEEERGEYAQKWRMIENTIGREELEKVIEFIRTIKLKQKARKSIIQEYEEKIFGHQILRKGKEFIDYVEKISQIYNKIILSPENLKINPKYKNLVRIMKDFIPFDDWIPPLIRFFEKFEEKSVPFLFDFLIALERKTVIEWVCGFTPSKRINSLNQVIEIIDQLDSQEEIIKKVYSTISEDLKEKFKEQLDSRDFYEENYAKYLLLRIDFEKIDHENFGGYSGIITIEHILPRNPNENSEWCKLFSKEEREEITNKMGNLVLLGRRKNASANNYDFAKKKMKYFFQGGSTPFFITRELEKIDRWTPEEFKKRHEGMLNILMDIYWEHNK